MSSLKWFSIIIPTLNEEQFIGDLIRSIHSQNYRPIEVVLVDGGSEDRTIEVTQSLKTQLEDSKFKIKILCAGTKSHQAHSLPYQRNLGIENSLGEYVVHLDADSKLLSEDFLEKLAKNLDRHKFVYFRVRMLVDNWLEYHLSQSFITVLPAYRREVFSVARFDESLAFGEDHDFLVRLRKLGIKPSDGVKVVNVEVGLHQPHTLGGYAKQRFWHARTVWPYIKKYPRHLLILLLQIAPFGTLFLACFMSLINPNLSIILLLIFFAGFAYHFSISPKKSLGRVIFLLLELIYGSFVRTVGALIGLIQFLTGSLNLRR